MNYEYAFNFNFCMILEIICYVMWVYLYVSKDVSFIQDKRWHSLLCRQNVQNISICIFRHLYFFQIDKSDFEHLTSCKDQLTTEACKILKEEKQCTQEYVAYNCMKTCGKCNGQDLCEDYLMIELCTLLYEHCSNEYVADNCQKTCGKCDGGDVCKDNWSAKKCEKKKNSCEKDDIYKQCMKTCKKCGNYTTADFLL